MSDIGNTQFLHNGGDAPSTPAASRNNEKPCTRSRSKEVLKVMEKNKDINKAQQTPPPSSSKKTAERRKKKDTPKKASTSASKKRKTNEKSEGRIGQTEVTKHVEKVIEKSKSKHKSIKKEVNKNSKHEQGEVPPHAYSPQQFIGLYICKEHNGVRNLGTVLSYDPKTKLFKILYDNDKTNDMELDELLKSKATAKDIFEARQTLQSSNSSKKTTNEEKEEATLSEEK